MRSRLALLALLSTWMALPVAAGTTVPNPAVWTFTSASGPVAGYMAEFVEVSGPAPVTLFGADLGSATTIRYPGGSPDTPLTVQVRAMAYDAAGTQGPFGPFSAPVRFAQAPPPPPPARGAPVLTVLDGYRVRFDPAASGGKGCFVTYYKVGSTSPLGLDGVGNLTAPQNVDLPATRGGSPAYEVDGRCGPSFAASNRVAMPGAVTPPIPDPDPEPEPCSECPICEVCIEPEPCPTCPPPTPPCTPIVELVDLGDGVKGVRAVCAEGGP